MVFRGIDLEPACWLMREQITEKEVGFLSAQESQLLVSLNEVCTEDVLRLHQETIRAILAITISYITGIAFFAVLLSLKSDYWFIAFIFPLLGYLWMHSFGAKYVNNRYGLKKTCNGVWIFEKKKQSYSTFVFIHILILLVSSIARLAYEINHLRMLAHELIKRRTDAINAVSNTGYEQDTP